MNDIQSLLKISKDLSILYVEDDPEIQKSMNTYLQKIFKRIVSASDGKEGLEAYEENEFDIVLTDLSMPRMNGIEMIEAIKKINENQAILITTAHTESNYMLSAIKDGVDGYIIKPFNMEQLNYELFKSAQKIVMYKENEAYKLHLSELVADKTRELEDLVDYQKNNYEKTLESMVSMIEQRDTYTAGHSRRVAKYSELIAQEMGYTKQECTLIHQAGILHDVGKIATPDAVLLNPKSLNDLEYKLIQGHVTVSYKLLSTIPMFNSLAEIVYSHHERYDGKGYPRGLKENEITKLARIIIVADSFDAMTTNRIYKARKTVKEALHEMRTLSGIQFDPEVVKSALFALKDIHIDENVNQLPQTKLEEERFAYFYKDSLSNTYNQNYLDVVLMKNAQEKFFDYISIVSLKDFSQYNKNNGWKQGDSLLKSIGNILIKNLTNTYIFRVFGDDFVILSKEDIPTQKINDILDEVLGKDSVLYQIHKQDLRIFAVEKVADIESIQLT
ncbi:MAG: putative nucleotidyltransferase with HDIG domain [Sulfurimonas sp.]|jgi:putative nucleotidyltransferase with HDIG domain|uniref:HD domain-containing phosphohydrolase n=1 Tax=Sulfurimonas sp. TaxID=2022749 RepID=UPI0039E6BC2E